MARLAAAWQGEVWLGEVWLGMGFFCGVGYAVVRSGLVW
jgi:hypothetical protein